VPHDHASLNPAIAQWLQAAPPVDVDVFDICAVRQMSADYMRETGGPAPRYTPATVAISETLIAEVPVLRWWHKASPAARTAVVAVHGGGFIVGSALGAERIAVPLATQHNIDTISVEYRLAPEHPAPAALADVIAVITELTGPRSPYSAIALFGSSAGACLAAGAAHWARDHHISIAGQVLSCPALDNTVIDDVWSPTWTPHAAKAMWHHYLSPDPAISDPLWGYVIPAHINDLSNVAPAHLVVAQHDTLRSQGLAYAQRLDAAGVPITVNDAPGTVHGFDGLLPDSDIATEAIDAQVQQLATWLRDD